jgi:hypothetical protein
VNRPAIHEKQLSRRNRGFNRGEGFDFVRCRICGDHRRVMSGRHLSKHGTDREEYMGEYGLSPDELIAKDFRRIRSSRRGFYPYGKKDWIVAIKKVYKHDGNIFAGHLQAKHAYLYNQGVWIFGDWDTALRAAGFDPEQMRLHQFWDREKVIKEMRSLRNRNQPLNARYVIRNYPSLFEAGRRHYGTWNKALRTVGITSTLMLKNSTGRRNLLKTLRNALGKDSQAAISKFSKLQVALYFGSLQSAKIALETDTKVLTGKRRKRSWVTHDDRRRYPQAVITYRR